MQEKYRFKSKHGPYSPTSLNLIRDQRSNLAEMSRSIERGLIAAQNRYSPTPIKARSIEPSLIRAQNAETLKTLFLKAVFNQAYISPL